MIDPRGSSFKNFTIIDRYLENIQKKKKKYSSLERNFLNVFFHRSFRTFPFESLLNFDLDSRESFQIFFFVQPSKRVQYTNNSHSSSNQLKLGSITSIRCSDIRNQKSIVQNPRGSPDVFRSGCTPHPFARRCDYV